MSSNILTAKTDKQSRESSSSSPPNKKVKASYTTITIPPDIVALIATFADNATRARLIRTSTANYDFVGPILYERITISRENASQLFMGLPRSPRTHNYSANDSQASALMELQWPDIPIDSDDGDDSTPDDNSSSDYFPTQTTYKRKVELLRHIKHIDIASIPDQKLCKDMRGWSRRLSRTTAEERSALCPGAKTVSFQSLSIYQLAIWSVKHTVGSSDEHSHPFVKNLACISSFDRYCFTIPCLKTEDFRSFASSIEGSKYLRSTSSTTRQIIKRKFDEVNDACRQIIEDITLNEAKNVTLHGWMEGCIPCGPAIIRVYFGDCYCTDNRRVKKTSCSQHQSRLIDIFYKLSDEVSFVLETETDLELDFSEPDLSGLLTEKFEFVSPSRDHLNMDEKQKIQWFDLKEKVLKARPAFGKLQSVMIEYKDADPCVCCGTKEGR